MLRNRLGKPGMGFGRPRAVPRTCRGMPLYWGVPATPGQPRIVETMATELRTARLVLREWREADVSAFVRMSSVPGFSEHLLTFADQAAAEAWVARRRNHFERHGYGPWVVELAESREFIGCVGLSVVPYEAAFTPAVEIAWRLSKGHRRQGYATEAAAAALADGFERLGLAEIVANTVPHNWPSRRVMERIGMERDETGDFDHPIVPPGHPLRRQVLYRARTRRPSPSSQRGREPRQHGFPHARG